MTAWPAVSRATVSATTPKTRSKGALKRPESRTKSPVRVNYEHRLYRSEGDMSTKITRRQFILRSAGAGAGGALLPAQAQNIVTDARQSQLKWSKAPCRFCGVGCGVNVAVKDGQVVATHGDPQAEVNRGVNCVKGYFLSKIMYGEDRLTRPLLRMKNGRYDKSGEFTPVTWDQAFDVMAQKWKAALKAKGPSSIGMFMSGQSTIWEGYAAVKLMK